MSNINKSLELYERSLKSIPGGVNSPVRAFNSVEGNPRFIDRGQGAYIFDVDGNRYLDYMMSWGPLILGHAPLTVVEAVQKAALKGTSFGASTEAEIELAELVKARFPAVEQLRLVNSGTEAAMTALRLARAATRRELIVKFDGCYHGHSDALLVKAGSGLATGGIAGSAGVPQSLAEKTVSIPYNDINALVKLFDQRGNEIAGVIAEPVAANMGVVLPAKGFLEKLRELSEWNRTILIFDEVISGFRVARGGACELYRVNPDLICFGKIIGGGLPIGAVGGREDVMEMLAPLGKVYQAGTLSGNPISVAAGIATLKALEAPGLYEWLARTTEALAVGLDAKFAEAGIPAVVNRMTGLLTVFFGEGAITNYEKAGKCDMKRFAKFHQAMLEKGIYLPPSGYEAWFLSTAHSVLEIDRTLEAVGEVAGGLG